MTHKLTVQINYHDEELIKKGIYIRQRQTGVHAYFFVKTKREIISDREDDKKYQDGNKDTSSVIIKDKSDCVGV